MLQNNNKIHCSVCGKVFNIDTSDKYFCNNGYTCSWKCFLKYVNRKHNKTRKVNKLPDINKPKRGRPPKKSGV